MLTSLPSKKLIINCDDFGWDAPATQAILELGAAGQISSTTCANCTSWPLLPYRSACTSP
jgi:predicted glycoside hydrolase/deacetylase ChbG (UPF0249 family)